MLRAVFVLIGLGGVLAFLGYQEYKVSQGTSKDPVPVGLAKLEYGVDAPNNHVEIGEHMAIYDALIYEYEERFSDPEGDDPNTKVNVVYYPIVSGSHPLAKKIEDLARRNPESITDEDIASITNEKFKVIVRTGRINKVGQLPKGVVKEDKVKGLIVNQISSLGWEEQKLIKQSFPNLDFKNLIILQENRKPSGPATSFGMMGGGGAMILVGLGLCFVSKSF
jgi:hypothetical protein